MLGAANMHIGVAEPEFDHRLAQKCALLFIRVVQRHAPRRVGDRERNAGQAAAGSDVCERAGLACTITMPEDDSSIPPDAGIALYRILQEALTNIVKYAQAKHVNVELGLTADAITLVIEDDGIGIHDAAQNNRLSHGISGMRQRVRALHGEFSIARRAKGGTAVKVRIPVAPRPAQDVVAEAVAEPVTPPTGG